MGSKTKNSQSRLFKSKDLDIKRSSFDLSFKNRLSANFGKIVPLLNLETTPGDSYRLRTDFFSRWLTMTAPTFTDVDLRFHSYFVTMPQIWGGWKQFLGEGDDVSADYLLGHESRNDMKVPYITTNGLSSLWSSSFLDAYPYNAGSQFGYLGNIYLREEWQDKFVLSVGLLLCYPLPEGLHLTSANRSQDVVDSGFDSGTISQIYSSRPVLVGVLMVVPRGSLHDSLVENGYLFDYGVGVGGNESDFITWIGSAWNSRKALYYQDFNLSALDGWSSGSDETGSLSHSMLNPDFSTFHFEPIPSSFMPIMTDMLYSYTDLVDDYSGSRLSGWGNGIQYNEDALFTYLTYNAGFVGGKYINGVLDDQVALGVMPSVLGITVNSNGSHAVGFEGYDDDAYSESTFFTDRRFASYFPAGCSFFHSIFDITYAYGYLNDSQNAPRVDRLKFWHMTYGQSLISFVMGDGTLSDYLGNPLSSHLLRQPFSAASMLYGYYSRLDVPFVDPPQTMREGGHFGFNTYLSPSGTYGDNSPLQTVGVVNDQPISLLPYLAYHKIWSDYTRDPRYELRFIYSDPYKSPFLVPNSSGEYVQGDLTAYQFADYMVLPNSSLSFYAVNASVGPTNVFTPFTLLELLGLRDRRIEHDFFSLVTPNSQYGEEVKVDVDLGLKYGSHGGVIHEGMSVGTNDPLYVNSQGEYYRSGGKYDLGTISGSSFSVNALRLAGKLQRFMERNNIVGSDYVRQQLIHFGYKPDSCQHCEVQYLGGDKITSSVDSVMMTSANTDDQQTGQMSGKMDAQGSVCRCSLTCKEHGIIMQTLTVQNDFFYANNVRRQNIDKFDFPFPELADLQPEEVPLKTLVNTDGTDTTDVSFHPMSRFGFAPRYWWKKCSFDQVHGDLRNSLSYWVTPRRLEPSLLGGSYGYGNRFNKPSASSSILYEKPNYNAFTYTGDDFDHVILDVKQFIDCESNFPVLPVPSIN